MDEFSLIKRLTSRGKSDPQVKVGIGDDAAVVSIHPRHDLILCCDGMSEHIHFQRDTMLPREIGYKALASNLSDIAAMGGIPKFALVTLSVPPAWSTKELEEIYEGIFDLAQAFKISVIGGDTIRTTKDLHLSVTVAGEVEKDKYLLRSTARPGDKLFITGYLGESAAGLHYLLAHGRKNVGIDDKYYPLVKAHTQPFPQLIAGRILQQTGIHALNDISDGLASESWEIAESSGVSLILYEDQIPISPLLETYGKTYGISPLDCILYGGEDYQLVGTFPSCLEKILVNQFQQAGFDLFIVGEVKEGPMKVVLIDRNGNENMIEKRGYNHFSE
ncbi:thiamine-phosphate kinase [Microaerobacter geothermalis]|uniref:thiamine-phosphate kinase n=1 Tax=Microaerobacter geothermalis TaxID=674972 RepID=UPI001F3F97FC|nr:thiamine-phosphate kinase [Microaerobacter geothermalis]MCF6093741.1 thiamine-phosphate kinase [Microaerobacter geothermalis]